MLLATLSVLFYSEIPLFRQPQEKIQLHALRWILIPHAIAGTFALIGGPFQFSRRLRQHHRELHRIAGRLYAASVGLAAPLAVLSTAYSHYPKAIYFKVAIVFQAAAWVITTGCGIYAAMRRRFAVHRVWMVRSYAVTFTFVATRVLQPIPAWNHLGRFWFAAAIICITCLALLVPQIGRSSRLLVMRLS
ncbi:hypothetical protein HDF16_000684 [Granulicella aggregans]|uniref:Uncharacterized protein n=1 Tax=Granulicella aggregans TaxID=474949 RepID=A0A7W8E3C6_9BACT|nr:DUF2306 domain-containing protein [Granulicella aggregans]MBB5056015.1 hypothetical protein [Granulicella aggregans]